MYLERARHCHRSGAVAHDAALRFAWFDVAECWLQLARKKTEKIESSPARTIGVLPDEPAIGLTTADVSLHRESRS
jgi:hypothetical protein